MTDLTIPLRWIDGHLARLDGQEAGVDHAWRAALTDEDRAVHAADLVDIQEAQRAWRAVRRLICRRKPRHSRRDP